MISIITILLFFNSICEQFQSFGHEFEYIEVEGIRFDPCNLNQDQSKLFELKSVLKTDTLYHIEYKTDLSEGYLIKGIGIR